MTERQTLRVDEVMAILGLGRNKVYEALKRGDIPAKQIGSKWIISKCRFFEWLNTSEEKEEL